MASLLSFDRDLNQVIFEGKNWLRKVVLNRPQQMNSLTHEMVSEMKRVLEEYEVDDTVKLIMLTGQGKAFCAGGDVVRCVQLVSTGHWTLTAMFYRKQLLLDYLIATYKKSLVVVMNGAVMGGGAGLSMNARFRIVTENTVFAMPEASIGLFPDVGEYLGLTGARISGAEMLECGLATHFVFSKDLKSLEDELGEAVYKDASAITSTLEKFNHKPNLKEDSACTRLDIIDKCFSKKTIEDILSSLETEVLSCGGKWMVNAINYMRSASPTSLKISLKSIREARSSTLEQCLRHDYIIVRHMIRRTFNNDFFEGSRAMFFDKDKKPKWNPPRLEEVSEEFVKKFFNDVDNDDDWDNLEFPDRKIRKMKISKL
ncbi:putative 3-hydroxyisobutyryl-CoA hydrolase 3 [Sesamum alatum]|uniref:3-hydroxyisobutyryl-CoA hydrolase n=1 Tax=Sesamum alatum TaxID=300844 RepID=A0AAE2CJS9_9LAMI|nr:putative 3-hydroxyisobutyryl-CoA hydrolase 3 [Sesamum alatum]